MKTIQFKCPKGIGPPTSVLVDGQPWQNILSAGLVILPGEPPVLTLSVRGDDVTATFENVTVIVDHITIPPAPAPGANDEEDA